MPVQEVQCGLDKMIKYAQVSWLHHSNKVDIILTNSVEIKLQ